MKENLFRELSNYHALKNAWNQSPLVHVAFTLLIIDALDIVIVLALDIVQIISIWIYLDTLSVVSASPVSVITRSYGECIPW